MLKTILKVILKLFFTFPFLAIITLSIVQTQFEPDYFVNIKIQLNQKQCKGDLFLVPQEGIKLHSFSDMSGDQKFRQLSVTNCKSNEIHVYPHALNAMIAFDSHTEFYELEYGTQYYTLKKIKSDFNYTS